MAKDTRHVDTATGKLAALTRRSAARVRRKRLRTRIAAWLIAVVGLLLSGGLFLAALRWQTVSGLVVGFVAMALCSIRLATLAAPVLGRPKSGLLLPVIGLVFAAGLTLVLTLATRGPLRAACEGAGVAEAAAFAPHPGPHPAVMLHNGRQLHRLPPEWQARSIKETELVLCVGSLERRLIETCQYYGGSEVKRYRYGAEVTLVEAQTGETLATEWFWGDAPRSCGLTEERSVRSLKGEKSINFAEVEAWLASYVSGLASVAD
jgi:hypothetical protein